MEYQQEKETLIEIERKYLLPPNSLEVLNDSYSTSRIIQLYTEDGFRYRHEANASGLSTYITKKERVEQFIGAAYEDESIVEIDLFELFENSGVDGLTKKRMEKNLNSSVKVMLDSMDNGMSFMEIEMLLPIEQFRKLVESGFTSESFKKACEERYIPDTLSQIGISAGDIVDVTGDKEYAMRAYARPVTPDWLRIMLQSQLTFAATR